MHIVAAWEQSIGRVKHQTRPIGIAVDAGALRGAVRRFTEVSERWSTLPYGGSLGFTWPHHLTIDLATSRKGRRRSRRTPHHARY